MLPDTVLTLAAQGLGPWGLAAYSGVLIGIVALMGIALMLIRRKFRAGLGEPPPALSVEQLEALRDQGQITPQEFSRLRRIALGLDPGAPKREQSFLTAKQEVVDEIRATEESSSPTKEPKDE